MPTYLAPNNIVYSGDPVFRDGIPDPQIPDRPSPRHKWRDGEWILDFWYDWKNLKDSLRGTPIFGIALQTTNQNAFTLLMATFDSSSPNEAKLADFVWAISAVRAGLDPDYTEEQLQNFRDLLQEYGFPVFL